MTHFQSSPRPFCFYRILVTACRITTNFCAAPDSGQSTLGFTKNSLPQAGTLVGLQRHPPCGVLGDSHLVTSVSRCSRDGRKDSMKAKEDLTLVNSPMHSLSTQHKLESLWEGGPSSEDYLYQTGLWASHWEHFLH